MRKVVQVAGSLAIVSLISCGGGGGGDSSSSSISSTGSINGAVVDEIVEGLTIEDLNSTSKSITDAKGTFILSGNTGDTLKVSIGNLTIGYYKINSKVPLITPIQLSTTNYVTLAKLLRAIDIDQNYKNGIQIPQNIEITDSNGQQITSLDNLTENSTISIVSDQGVQTINLANVSINTEQLSVLNILAEALNIFSSYQGKNLVPYLNKTSDSFYIYGYLAQGNLTNFSFNGLTYDGVYNSTLLVNSSTENILLPKLTFSDVSLEGNISVPDVNGYTSFSCSPNSQTIKEIYLDNNQLNFVVNNIPCSGSGYYIDPDNNQKVSVTLSMQCNITEVVYSINLATKTVNATYSIICQGNLKDSEGYEYSISDFTYNGGITFIGQ